MHIKCSKQIKLIFWQWFFRSCGCTVTVTSPLPLPFQSLLNPYNKAETRDSRMLSNVRSKFLLVWFQQFFLKSLILKCETQNFFFKLHWYLIQNFPPNFDSKDTVDQIIRCGQTFRPSARFWLPEGSTFNTGVNKFFKS